MPEGVSQRQFAKMIGVSETAVRNALKAKRIEHLPDGSIDPEAARAAWEASTDPARSRVRTEAGVRTETEAREAVSLVARILAEEGVQDDGKGIDFNKARTVEMILRSRQRDLDQAVQEGSLVNRAAAEKLFFELARENRDAWMAWPSRIAIEMADSIAVDRQTGKVDPRSLTTALNEFVRQHLMEMGEQDPDGLRA